MPSARCHRVRLVPLVPAFWLFSALPSRAEERGETSPAAARPGEGSRDRFVLNVRSETYVQLFQRALLPGPNGAIVSTETAVPINEYVFADARDIDSPWHEDSIDFELAAWGQLWPTESSVEPTVDGDVQVANLRYHAGPAWVRLGRQQVAGGAARFARFDGGMIGLSLPIGLFAEGYGGFSVLPRWNAQPGYHHLGALEGEVTSETSETLDRSGYWLAGGRIGYAVPRLNGSVSFHESHETSGVEQRNLGFDLGARPADQVSFGGNALLELDSQSFSNLRLWVDSTPLALLDLGAEFLHTEPALLLSRQSVLSVFASEGYDEIGGTFTLRTLPFLRFEGNGYLQFYEGTGPGARGELAARLSTGRVYATLVRIAYARVIAPENGYQSLRASFSRKLSRRIGSTLEAYGYFYDEAIAGYTTSSVYAGTLSYRVSDPFELLWGGSVAQSPYAALDAQTMLRASYDFDAPAAGRRR
jgi:hypothetical protein